MFSHTGPLLVLCSVLTSALCCDWLTDYSDLRNSSVNLVELMVSTGNTQVLGTLPGSWRGLPGF